MLGKSSSPWEQVYLTDHERLERTQVPGGWVYRDWVLWSSDSSVPQIALVYVPSAALPAPINVDVPAVTGVGAVGDTLTCTMGNWNNEPTGYAYQWLSTASGVADNVGANTNSYTIQPSDAGRTITCVVTATNSGGSTVAPPSNQVVVPA